MQILRFDVLDSTNAYAKRNCSLLADQTVIIARQQTAGRGRLDRKWISQEGGLYFSLLLKPQKTDFLPNLTQLMALCVCESLRELGAESHLKWPNDVLVHSQKICGILSEALFSPKGFEGLVLGVGLNIAQQDLANVGQPATSLALQNIHTNEDALLQDILNRFFDKYEELLQCGFRFIRNEYLNFFPYVGKKVQIKNTAQNVIGAVQTISPEGKLVLQTPEGFIEISIGDMMV
ncbi:MAG: biotin--[Elusimicrobiaceae bacterium]|nr:biotin--[acetyl-CoA-carboxylase] ligase [Elusimicrobiaceae bacterium]